MPIKKSLSQKDWQEVQSDRRKDKANRRTGFGKVYEEDPAASSYRLEKFDFADKGHGVYVPWSFNSFRADEFFAKEIGNAFAEQGNQDDLPALQDPHVIDPGFSVK